MPWEKRQRGGRYYTRTRGTGGRRVREYIGGGPAGEAAAAADAARRAERQALVRALQAEQDRLRAADAPVLALCGVADLLAKAALVGAGYHQHHRGEWRLRKHGDEPTPTG